MFRRSIVLVGFVAVAGVAANLNAGFIDNFDTGYIDTQYLASPWTAQPGPQNIWVRELPTYSLSGDFTIGQDGSLTGEGLASRTTGVGMTDTAVVAEIGFMSGSGNWSVFALSSSADPGGDRWRGIAGAVAMMWTPSYGVELYSATNYNPVSGIATGVPLGEYVNFRISVPLAAGSQTAVFAWKLATDSVWTDIGSVTADSTFSAANIGVALTGNNWGDDVQFSSVPEPSSLVLMLGGLVGLLAYAWRKRK